MPPAQPQPKGQPTARANGQELHILGAVETVNEQQKKVLLSKITKRFGADLTGRRFAVWGLAFKPNTDDMREAPSRVLIEGLWNKGATVVAYDPIAVEETKRIYGSDVRINYAASPNDALRGADALTILTEWKVFRSPDFAFIKQQLRQPVIFDGRNLYDPALLKNEGIEYYPIGRKV